MNLFRGIVQGPGGSGKTSLACGLADAGYQVIRCGFEPGQEVFKAYCKKRENVHDLMFEDNWDFANGRLKRVPRAMSAFEKFVYTGEYGGTRPVGRPSDWGPATVLFVDTITTMGKCSEAREELTTTTNMGMASWEADKAIVRVAEFMTSRKQTYHTVWLSHLRLLSPKTETGYVRDGQLVTNETPLQVQVKRERAKLEETGYYPSCVTGGIARNFVANFPFALFTELALKEKCASKRIVRTKPILGYQIKCPLEVEDRLPVETALVTIFEGLKDV